MKGKEAISGVLGGICFAGAFLAGGTPLIPALLIGTGAFVGGELIMSKTEIKPFDKVDEKNVDKVLADARKKNKYILDTIPRIDDEVIQKNLREINATTTKIINTVAKDKSKIKQSEKFFTYYFPITIEIVGKYDNIEDQKLSSSDAKKFFKSAHESIEEINRAYKKILESLYENDIESTETDMKVLNNILKSDGFNELNVKKEENDE